MNKDTIQFGQRRGRVASSIPTVDFTKAFAAMFLSSTPNAAITIQQKSSGVQLSKPVVAINNGNYMGLQYTFEQSGSQAVGGSLEAFVKVVGDGINNGCSLFIDTGLLL